MICSSFPKAFNKGAMNAHPDSATFAKANVQEIPIKDRVILALDVPTVDEAEKMAAVRGEISVPEFSKTLGA